MTHLTSEQLSALHDRALAPAELAAAEAHLAACVACRAELAALAALDASLDTALAYDPGEKYFADFAGRVQARIAAEAAQAAPAPVAPVRAVREAPKHWSWFAPRSFGFVGAAAALVVTAGLAWMMFGRTLAPSELMRASAPAQDEQVQRDERLPLAGTADATGAVDAVVPQAAKASPAADGRSEAPGSRREAKSSAPSASIPSASEFTAPQGNEQAAPPPVVAPAPAEAEALTKQRATRATEDRAVAPSATAPLPKKARTNTLLGTAQGLLGGQQKPNATTPSLAPPTAAGKDVLQLRGGRAGEVTLMAESLPIDPPCGVVRDTRGTPVRGAQLTLLGATTRTSRSAADGTFCLEQPVAGDTLVVMRVGFEPVRLVLVSSAALALALEPVGTLGSQDGLVTGRGDDAGFMQTPRLGRAAAPAADVYEHESAVLRDAVSGAREAAAIAARERTPEAWERAAGRWRAIAAATTGAPAYDASFRELSALREAMTLSPTSERAARFKQAAAAFVAGTPRTLPERATVQRWNIEAKRYSTYR